MTAPNGMKTTYFVTVAQTDYDNRPLVRTEPERSRITMRNRHGFNVITIHEFASSAAYHINTATATGLQLIRKEIL
jgi:hypothetical protein